MVGCLHVNDNNGKDDRHYPPYLYRGGIDWKGVMQELKAIHYNDDFNFEVRFPARGLPDNFSNRCWNPCSKQVNTCCLSANKHQFESFIFLLRVLFSYGSARMGW